MCLVNVPCVGPYGNLKLAEAMVAEKLTQVSSAFLPTFLWTPNPGPRVCIHTNRMNEETDIDSVQLLPKQTNKQACFPH